MFYIVEDKKLVQTDTPDFNKECIGLFAYEEFSTDLAPVGDFPKMVETQTHNRHMYLHVEPTSFSGKVLIKDKDGSVRDDHCVYFFISKKLLILIEQSGDEMKPMSFLNGLPREGIAFDEFFMAFFYELVNDDLPVLERLEIRLTEIEESVLINKEKNFNDLMSKKRRTLLRLHHFYEEFEDLIEVLIDNENHAFSEANGKRMHRFLLRVNRLQDSTRLLRDYTTTLQQIYQSQVDLRQNDVVRVLTVVTTIFFPLSLLTGWYGMNFTNMPELTAEYGYIGIILASVVIVILSIFIFKRYKFF